MADSLYTKAELAKKSLGDLRELVNAHDLEIDTDQERPTKPEMITALLELDDTDALVDTDDIEEEDDELDDIDEEEVDDIEEAPKPKAKSKAAAKPKASARATKAVDGEELLAAKQVATTIGTEAKTLRQFLRSDASTFEAVGSGGRYEFRETDIAKISEEFAAWKAAHASRGRKASEGGSTRGRKAKSTEPVEEVEEVEEIEELEELDDELDDDDLELDD